MEKIEVELTPVRIVGQPTAVTVQRPQNEVGITVLKFKIVIPKIEQLGDDVEHIIPSSVDVKIPDEYVGCYDLLNHTVLSDTYQVYIVKQENELKQHLLEQDYEQDLTFAMLPKFDTLDPVLSTHIVQTQSVYGVAEFSNVPQLYINLNGKLVSRADLANTERSEDDVVGSLFDRLQATYKGETFDTYNNWWKLTKFGYMYAVEADYIDGHTEEVWTGDNLDYRELSGIKFDSNNLPSAIYFVFKHNDHKSRAKIFDISNQPVSDDIDPAKPI